jgi:hypothetical protein
MPTPDEIRTYRQWRGRFISAVWDAEAAGASPAVTVADVLDSIGAGDLPLRTVSRLVNDLVGDGLLEPVVLTQEADYPLWVKLTSCGRLEVERWISDDVPTEHLALPPNQVFNTNVYGNVSGSAVIVGSTDTTVNMQAAVGEQLSVLVAKAKELLAAWNGLERVSRGRRLVWVII